VHHGFECCARIKIDLALRIRTPLAGWFLGIFIHPRRSRGGGNVGIGFIDFQGVWEGRKTGLRFPGFPHTVISTACLDHLEVSGGDLHRCIHPVLLELDRS
jgi:hypothetical protein